MSETVLFGDVGRRVETIEWGTRWPADTYLHRRGGVDPADGQEHAEHRAAQTYWSNGATYQGEVVSRVVVTYTSGWVRS